MKPLETFVVTRFSLRIPDWEKKASITEESRERWFRYRAKIFNDTTLKCVVAQSMPVKRLFLLMDAGDIELFAENILQHDIIEPIFARRCDYISELDEKILSMSRGPMLVARLDSDDLIASSYFEAKAECIDIPALQARARKEGRLFIKATNGYITDLRFIQPFYDVSPSFISTYYPVFRGELDLGGDHRYINQRNPVECADAEWMRLVHGSNVANSFLRRRVVVVDKNTWPSAIMRPPSEVIDKSLFGHKTGKGGRLQDLIRLWLLSKPGGAFFVKGMFRAKRLLRRLQAKLR